MSNICDYVREVVSKGLITKNNPSLAKHCIVLSETDKLAKCREVRVEVNGFRSICLKPDKVTSKEHLYNPTHFDDKNGLRSKCDYIIFLENATHVKIVIANMKSSNIGNSSNQILSGVILASDILANVFRVVALNESTRFQDLLDKCKKLKIASILFYKGTTKRTTNYKKLSTKVDVVLLGKLLQLKVKRMTCNSTHSEQKFTYDTA